jgi:hypothetical protein
VNPNVRFGVAVFGVAAILVAIVGGPVLPHQLLGISTETLVGGAIVAFLPMVFITLQLITVVQNRRIMRGIEYLASQGMVPPGKIVPFNRRRSG